MKPEKEMPLYLIKGVVEQPGAITTFEIEQERAWQLILFLRMNNLVTNDLLPRKKKDITIDFRMTTSDVTDEGFEVLKLGLYKWIDSNDSIYLTKMKMGVLEKALEKVRLKH
ncbi:MAG: hypothetical protein RLZZ76_644 [Candidatus Parcubacteria bacterium]